MRKIFFIFLFTIALIFKPIINPTIIYGENECTDIVIKGRDNSELAYIYRKDLPLPNKITQIEFSIKVNQKGIYRIYGDDGNIFPIAGFIKNYSEIKEIKDDAGGEISGIIKRGTLLIGTQIVNYGQFDTGDHKLTIQILKDGKWENFGTGTCGQITYNMSPPVEPEPAADNCKINIIPEKGIQSKTEVTISVDKQIDLNYYSPNFTIVRVGKRQEGKNTWGPYRTTTVKRTWEDGRYDVTFNTDIINENVSYLTPVISFSCKNTFIVDDKNGGVPTPTLVPTIPPQCIGHDAREARASKDCSSTYIVCNWCTQEKPKIDIPNLKPLCDQLGENYKGDCWVCQRKGEIWSAIGCLPTDFSALVNKYVFTTGVGIAGSIAFLYFIYGAFMILTSSGNAEKMEEAKQIITSSLAGLILIIFSVFLLKTIGVDILKLPEFG